MAYKGVIFDLDGTLVNSIEDLADAMNMVLKSHSYPTYDYETYKTFVGSGIRSLVINALPEQLKTNKAKIDTCFNAMKHIYSENCTIKTKAYDGIYELLEKLKTHDIKLSILSNKADVLTKKVASHLFPDCFDNVHGLTSEKLKKPNSTIALQICKTMHLTPEEIVFIGDSAPDIKTALAANMLPIGVSWGFRSKESLIKIGASQVLNHPLDLIPILGCEL
jgi:phosphoglycolate phosphatase